MNTVNTEFSSVKVWFIDQASKTLNKYGKKNYWILQQKQE